MKMICLTKVCRVLALAFLLVGAVAEAQTSVWTGGGSDGKWTNPDNWKDGVVPGRLTVNSTLTGQGGDCAEFPAVAGGAQTTIDLAGLTSIGGVRIVGADAPAYRFGTSTADAQILKFEADGTGLYVGADVMNAPTFGSRYQIVYATSDAPLLTICNDSTNCVLNLPSAVNTLKAPDYTGSIALSYIDFRGAGDIRIGAVSGYAFRDFGWYLNQTGKLVIGVTLEGGYGKYTPMMFIAGSVPSANGKAARIEVEKDVAVTGSRQWGPSFNVGDSDVEICGEGTWGFNWRAGYDKGEARVRIAQGRKLTISCKYAASTDKEENPGIRGYKGNGESSTWYGGTWTFRGENVTPGPLQNFFGNMETDRSGGFGQGEIQLSESSILRYCGAEDWTMTQPVCITNWPSRLGLSGRIETVAEKGTWTLAGGLSLRNSSTSGTGTFTLAGDGDGVVSGIIENGEGSRVTAIAKAGVGTWTLAGANTFSGATTVNAGVLKVAATGSLAASSGLSLKGGKAVFVGGDTTVVTQELKNLSVTTASSTLELTGNIVVKAADFAADTGLTLDIIMKAPGGKLIVPTDKPTTVKREKFTLNGQPVIFGADGEVKLDADAIIAARGAVVPNNNGKVAIVYDGTSGNDTLAADVTSVTELKQAAKTAATIAIGEGRTLSVSSVGRGKGAADLLLGAAGDAGRLDSTTKQIVYENQDEGGEIVINAPFAPGVTNEFAYGKVVLAGGTTLGETRIAVADKAKAALEIRNGVVETGVEPIYIGANTGNNYNGGGTQYGELIVSNAVVRNVADLARASQTYAHGVEYGIFVGKNANGTLRIQDGAVISNKLQIGVGAGGLPGETSGYESTGGRGSGAVYQTGGKMVTLGRAEYRANAMGNGTGTGYYELKGGSFEGYMSIATYGNGFWSQFPGTTADLKALSVATGNGGRGDVYIRGQVTATTGNSQLSGGYQNGNLSVLTVDGPGVLDCDQRTVFSFISSVVATSRVNIVHGGTVKVANFYRHASAPAASRFSISSDGGTFVAALSTTDYFAYDSKTCRVDDIRIYGGGMTIDTRNWNTGTYVPLQKPEGKGIAAVPFDLASFPKRNVPPYIYIHGDGDGATAHALYDSDSQSVTGVVVTCAGTGYTWAKAEAVYRGIYTARFTNDCVLVDNDQTGSFTKTGSGTFTLNATNTWGGATIVKGGTLKAGVDHAIPAGTRVVLMGGTLDFNGKTGTVSHLTYGVGGGSIVNAGNVSLPSGFDMVISAEEILAGKSIALEGNPDLAGKTLTITGDFSALNPEVRRRYAVVSVMGGAATGQPTIVAPDLPKEWMFVSGPGGVQLVAPRGVVIFIR